MRDDRVSTPTAFPCVLSLPFTACNSDRSHIQAARPFRSVYAVLPVRHCLCLVFPLPSWLRRCLCLAFPLPLPCVSTALMAKALPLPCGPQADRPLESCPPEVQASPCDVALRPVPSQQVSFQQVSSQQVSSPLACEARNGRWEPRAGLGQCDAAGLSPAAVTRPFGAPPGTWW